MQGARMAAEHGQKEAMLLRFPCQLCIDGGRAINVAEQYRPATLRGSPAEIYLRWERSQASRVQALCLSDTSGFVELMYL